MVPGARVNTVEVQGRCNGNGVTKEPGNSRKHLIQMFHCRMEECSSAAKRSTNNQYVCKYIGRINDQSNWSGPFSLVVMTLDLRSRGTWFDPLSGHSTGYFLYRSVSPLTTLRTDNVYLPLNVRFPSICSGNFFVFQSHTLNFPPYFPRWMTSPIAQPIPCCSVDASRCMSSRHDSMQRSIN